MKKQELLQKPVMVQNPLTKMFINMSPIFNLMDDIEIDGFVGISEIIEDITDYLATSIIEGDGMYNKQHISCLLFRLVSLKKALRKMKEIDN